MLITLDHPALAAPLRVGTDSVDTISRGNTFVAYPLEFYMPVDEDGRPPVARIRIDNIDQDISTAIRSINSPPTVLIELVLSGSPHEVVATFADFRLERATYDPLAIEGELTLKQFGREPFPCLSYTPGRFESIYRML